MGACQSMPCCDPPSQSGPQTPERNRARTSSSDGFKPANSPWRGPLGLGILPAVKEFLRDALMHQFLSEMYNDEIKRMADTNPAAAVHTWSAVAHCPPPSSAHKFDGASMNVAMPDMSAEYWSLYIPANKAPVFEITFPFWAVYTAITIYDSHGLPVCSCNSREAAHFLSTGKPYHKMGSVLFANGKMFLNLLKETAGEIDCSGRDPQSNSGALCAIFRVYRPKHIDLTPSDELPKTYMIDRSEVVSFDPNKTLPPPLAQATQKAAFESGKRIETRFQKLISKHMKPLKPRQLGSQFFHPSSVAGLFVNANATYVISFLASSMKGMRMRTAVPNEERHRPYYGIMTVDYNTTKTISSLTWEELGGWGTSFELFVARNAKDAALGGYSEKNAEHRLLLWSDDLKGPLGLCLRYLHYFERCGLEGEEEDIERAAEEREALLERNGDFQEHFTKTIPGLSDIAFF